MSAKTTAATKPRAAIYCRVSTDEQAGEGKTSLDQERRGRHDRELVIHMAFVSEVPPPALSPVASTDVVYWGVPFEGVSL